MNTNDFGGKTRLFRECISAASGLIQKYSGNVRNQIPHRERSVFLQSSRLLNTLNGLNSRYNSRGLMSTGRPLTKSVRTWKTTKPQ